MRTVWYLTHDNEEETTIYLEEGVFSWKRSCSRKQIELLRNTLTRCLEDNDIRHEEIVEWQD